MRGLAVTVMFVVGACAHGGPRIAVTGSEVLKHTTELGRDGSAQLATQAGGQVNVSVDEQVRFRGATNLLVKLLEGCAPFAGTTPCAFRGHEDELVFLRTTELREPKPDRPPPAATSWSTRHQVRVVTGTLSLASFGGAVVCLAYCDSDKWVKTGAFAGSGLLFALIFALAAGDVHD